MIISLEAERWVTETEILTDRDLMNEWYIYIPIGMSSHISKSVFPIIGALFAVEKIENVYWKI